MIIKHTHTTAGWSLLVNREKVCIKGLESYSDGYSLLQFSPVVLRLLSLQKIFSGKLADCITPEIVAVNRAFIGDPLVREWTTLTTDAITPFVRLWPHKNYSTSPKSLQSSYRIEMQDDVKAYQREGT